MKFVFPAVFHLLDYCKNPKTSFALPFYFSILLDISTLAYHVVFHIFLLKKIMKITYEYELYMYNSLIPRLYIIMHTRNLNQYIFPVK